MSSVYKINGTTIKRPTDFNIEKYKVTKATRSASALMNMDVIAKKLKFLLKYEVLSGYELKAIEDLIYTNDPFFTLTYNDLNGEQKTATVYAGAIAYKKFRSGSVWYWQDVRFDLIER